MDNKNNDILTPEELEELMGNEYNHLENHSEKPKEGYIC